MVHVDVEYVLGGSFGGFLEGPGLFFARGRR
jgi:hypothetical protein